jgi:hypothetical protein
MPDAAPTVPSDVIARVESAELETLIRKVQGGGTLTQSERQTFTKLSEKYGASPAGVAIKPTDDPVPVLQDEGKLGEKPTRAQKAARVQVVQEWMGAFKSRVEICQLAAKRWGIAVRSADDLIAGAKQAMADPRNTSRQVFRSMQLRGLQALIAARIQGRDERDPLDAMRELAKLLGLNEPDRADVRQEIATPDGQPLVVFNIPDNGRKLTTEETEPEKPASEATGT